jgi:hypothetical protein
VIYRLFGWWYRWQACKFAAAVIAGRPNDEGRLVHNYAVFFEKYMVDGANDTAEFFGAEIVTLKAASDED